jgi:hypothetical protein
LETGRTINGVVFDGSQNITIGCLAVDVTGTLSLAQGGTSSTTASGARTNLGLGATDDVIHGSLTTADLNVTSSTSHKPVFNVENTNSNSAGAVIRVYKNTPSPDINDTIGRFNFLSKNNQGSGRVYSSIIARIHDPLAATLSGELKFNLWSAGSESTVMTLLDDRVGIGTTTPAEKLDVVGNITASGTVSTGSYTVSTLPAVGTGQLIFVTNEVGGAIHCFSDGTNWRRLSDRAIVS